MTTTTDTRLVEILKICMLLPLNASFPIIEFVDDDYFLRWNFYPGHCSITITNYNLVAYRCEYYTNNNLYRINNRGVYQLGEDIPDELIEVLCQNIQTI